MFRRLDCCRCVYEAMYYLSGYDKESIRRFSICSKCACKESALTEEEIENKEQKIIKELWDEELQEPSDDYWVVNFFSCM